MHNFLYNPAIKFKKRYKNNTYITFLKLTEKVELLLFYHKSMMPQRCSRALRSISGLRE